MKGSNLGDCRSHKLGFVVDPFITRNHWSCKSFTCIFEFLISLWYVIETARIGKRYFRVSRHWFFVFFQTIRNSFVAKSQMRHITNLFCDVPNWLNGTASYGKNKNQSVINFKSLPYTSKFAYELDAINFTKAQID